jgi:hypothetical protein
LVTWPFVTEPSHRQHEIEIPDDEAFGSKIFSQKYFIQSNSKKIPQRYSIQEAHNPSKIFESMKVSQNPEDQKQRQKVKIGLAERAACNTTAGAEGRGYLKSASSPLDLN